MLYLSRRALLLQFEWLRSEEEGALVDSNALPRLSRLNELVREIVTFL